MSKPLFKLTTKDFLNGISPSGAHPATGGLFFKADGVTTLFEAGASQSVNNGLLMPGAVGASIAGNLGSNKITCSTNSPGGSALNYAYFGTDTGHILRLTIDASLSNTFSDLATAGDGVITSIEAITDTAGGLYVMYFQDTHVGLFSVPYTLVSDTQFTISTGFIHPSHRYFNSILYGNDHRVAQIVSTGAATFTSTNVLTTKPGYIITDISDDSTYAIIAITDNVATDPAVMGDTRILFWDTFSTSWNREYSIPDPFIMALEKTPLGVFAYGVTGIWQVFFGAEPRKVFSHPTGVYTVLTQTALKYGRNACSHYGDALMWGGTSGSNYAVKTFGKLQSDLPTAYLHPFLSTASQNITYVNGQIAKGYVVVGDDGPNLKAYPFSSSGTPNTGVTAQTVYIPLETKTAIERIDLVFGEPLASGDSVSVSVYTDQDTSPISFGPSPSYANDGAIRRKPTYGSATCEDQVSILLTFTAGAVKIKSVCVYGTPMS